MANSGTLTLQSGTRQAHWNGLGLWLGFAPQAANGEVRVHPFDVVRNLSPLIVPEPPPAMSTHVVVLDPGHGGGNAGTRSVIDGQFEKEFTLDWAARLQPLLVSQGWEVWLTRTNDVERSLTDRVAFADERRAALFLSLHFNSASTNAGGPSGLETYCLTPSGLPSTLVRGSDDDPAAVFPNNGFDDANLHLAVRLHQELTRRTGEPDRGVRRARFMGVLRGQKRPAVLIEGGYLSNVREAELIGSPGYRQQLAEAVAKALGPPW